MAETTKVEYLLQERYVNRPDAPWRDTGYGPYGEGEEQDVRDLVERLNANEAEQFAADDPDYVETRPMKKTTTVTVEEI